MGGDVDEQKFISRYAFLLNDEAITWNSKKQTCIALSTMEVEYVAYSAAVQEAVWLRRFLRYLRVVTHHWGLVTIYCDSSNKQRVVEILGTHQIEPMKF